MKEQNNIEELFQEAFKGFEADPGANAWANIQSGIGNSAVSGASATAVKATASWISTGVIGLTISAIAVGGYYFFDKQGEEKKNKAISNTEVINTPLDSDQQISSDAIEQNTNSEFIEKDALKEEAIREEESLRKSSSSDLESNSKEITKSTTETSKTADKNTVAVDDAEIEAIIKSANQASEEVSSYSTEQSGQAESKSDVLDEKLEASNNKVNTTSGDDLEENKVVAPEVYLPNIFSPNADGKNDYFELKTGEADLLEVEIYSGTEGIVFSEKGKALKWDGNLPNGSIAPEGFYIYQLVITKDGKQFPKKGSLQLVREKAY